MKKRTLQWGTSGDAVLLMSVKFVTIVLGFAITRLLSQYLSVYDYGTYSQVMLLVSTVNTLTILGMIDGVNFFYCSVEDPKKRESYITTIFALQCIVSAAAGAVEMILCRQICGYFDNPELGGLLIFSAVLPLLINLLSMFQVLLVAVGKARMLAVRNLLVSLIRLGAVLVVVTSVQNVAIVLMTTLILDCAQIIFFAWILWKNNCRMHIRSVDFGLFKRIVSYCAPMGVFTAVSALNRDCDKYLISLMTDTETLAIYVNASKVLPFDVIMTAFCTVLVPVITRSVAEKRYEKAGGLYKLFLEISYISTAVLCCASLAAAPQLMELLYSAKYLGGLSVFCIYILVDLLRFSNITLVLAAAGKTKKLMIFSVGSLLINIILNVLLYRLMGVPGPAVATLVTTLGLGLVILGSGAKELHTGLGALFDIKFLLRFAAESLVLTLLLRCGQQWLAAKGVHYFAILVLVAGVYGGVMLLLHGKRLLCALKQVNTLSSRDGGASEQTA